MTVNLTAIVPKPFNQGAFRLHLLNVARKVRTGVKRDFERTVETFESKPKFETALKFSVDELRIDVFTNDENYRSIVEGTSEHDITLSPGKRAFFFHSDFVSKTMPGVIGSREGSEGVNEVFVNPGQDRTMKITGITPREFDKVIADKWQPVFEEIVQEELDLAVEDSGHSL